MFNFIFSKKTCCLNLFQSYKEKLSMSWLQFSRMNMLNWFWEMSFLHQSKINAILQKNSVFESLYKAIFCIYSWSMLYCKKIIIFFATIEFLGIFAKFRTSMSLIKHHFLQIMGLQEYLQKVNAPHLHFLKI